MNIKDLQKEVYKTTVDLGYKINKKTTVKKLKEEFKEFKVANTKNKGLAYPAKDIKSDKDFKQYFDAYIKGSEFDEIPDMIFVLLSYCEEVGIDAETLIKNKLRYNYVRNKY